MFLSNIKILSPIDASSEAEKLIEAGADEFYCGLFPEEWKNKYFPASIDRRPTGSHLKSFEELKELINISHEKSVPVYLTLNEHYYTEKQYPLITEFIGNAISINVDALIIADLALLLFLRKNNFKVKIHISTGGTVFNSEAAGFYKDLGADRIILPRHLTVEEIGKLREHSPDIELEAFILNSRCVNVDGMCTFQHGLSGPSNKWLFRNACMLPYEISILPNENSFLEIEDFLKREIALKRQHIWGNVHIDDSPCGACSLFDFAKMGLTGVKIVGRGNLLEKKLKDVVFLKSAKMMLRNGETEKSEFRKRVKELYEETYKRQCRYHMCYYPEGLF